MKAMILIRSLAALSAATVVGSTFAAPGYEVPAAGFVSSKSRADVINELKEAKANGLATSNRIDGDENIGARGPAGSRYSMPAGEGTSNPPMPSHKPSTGNTPNTPNDLYFGD